MANFTEYFSTYLKTHELPSALDKFPVDVNGKSFKQRFIERNYYKEIGSETEELFEMQMQIKCDECVEDFLWRIEMFNANYGNLLDRFVNTHDVVVNQNDGKDVSTGDDKTYLNPIDEQSGVLSDRVKGDSSVTYGKKVTTTEDRQKPIYFTKSNPELMKAVFELEDIYTKALEYLDVLFMVIL